MSEEVSVLIHLTSGGNTVPLKFSEDQVRNATEAVLKILLDETENLYRRSTGDAAKYDDVKLGFPTGELTPKMLLSVLDSAQCVYQKEFGDDAVTVNEKHIYFDLDSDSTTADSDSSSKEEPSVPESFAYDVSSSSASEERKDERKPEFHKTDTFEDFLAFLQPMGSNFTKIAPQLAQTLLQVADILKGENLDLSCIPHLEKVASGDLSDMHLCCASCFQDYFLFDSYIQELIRTNVRQCIEKENLSRNPETMIHPHIICDGCNCHPLIGPRYRSLKLDDYDLCSFCFETMVIPSEQLLFQALRPDGSRVGLDTEQQVSGAEENPEEAGTVLLSKVVETVVDSVVRNVVKAVEAMSAQKKCSSNINVEQKIEEEVKCEQNIEETNNNVTMSCVETCLKSDKMEETNNVNTMCADINQNMEVDDCVEANNNCDRSMEDSLANKSTNSAQNNANLNYNREERSRVLRLMDNMSDSVTLLEDLSYQQTKFWASDCCDFDVAVADNDASLAAELRALDGEEVENNSCAEHSEQVTYCNACHSCELSEQVTHDSSFDETNTCGEVPAEKVHNNRKEDTTPSPQDMMNSCSEDSAPKKTANFCTLNVDQLGIVSFSTGTFMGDSSCAAHDCCAGDRSCPEDDENARKKLKKSLCEGPADAQERRKKSSASAFHPMPRGGTNNLQNLWPVNKRSETLMLTDLNTSESLKRSLILPVTDAKIIATRTDDLSESVILSEFLSKVKPDVIIGPQLPPESWIQATPIGPQLASDSWIEEHQLGPHLPTEGPQLPSESWIQATAAGPQVASDSWIERNQFGPHLSAEEDFRRESTDLLDTLDADFTLLPEDVDCTEDSTYMSEVLDGATSDSLVAKDWCDADVQVWCIDLPSVASNTVALEEDFKIVKKIDPYDEYALPDIVGDLDLKTEIIGYQVHGCGVCLPSMQQWEHLKQNLAFVPGTAPDPSCLFLGNLTEGAETRIEVFLKNSAGSCSWPKTAKLKLVYGDGAGVEDLALDTLDPQEFCSINLNFRNTAACKKDYSFWALCCGDKVFGQQIIAVCCR